MADDKDIVARLRDRSRADQTYMNATDRSDAAARIQSDAATIAALREALGLAEKHLKNASKRLKVQPDEVGDAMQLQINCDKGLNHVTNAIAALRSDADE